MKKSGRKWRIILAIGFLLAAGLVVWMLPSIVYPSDPDGADLNSGDVIYIQPLGKIDKEKLNIIKAILVERFEKEVMVLPDVGFPAKSLDQERGQYNASVLQAWGQSNVPTDAFRYIVLTKNDIYSARYNFIFGCAMMSGKVSVISLNRFDPGLRWLLPSERKLFRTRMEKLLVHELGHTFGLQHCDENCVMHFSNSVEEQDADPADFCEKCSSKLNRISGEGVLTDKDDDVSFYAPSIKTGE